MDVTDRGRLELPVLLNLFILSHPFVYSVHTQTHKTSVRHNSVSERMSLFIAACFDSH